MICLIGQFTLLVLFLKSNLTKIILQINEVVNSGKTVWKGREELRQQEEEGCAVPKLYD